MIERESIKLKRQLELIKESVSNDIYNLGDQFFEKIVWRLNEVLKADYTFIAKLTDDKTKVETISIVNTQGAIDNITYDLKNTPCENVVAQGTCSYSKDISALFPMDQLLIDMEIEAYAGVPLYDSKKNAIGILVSLFKKELKNSFAIESILIIFGSRASAELEHLKLYSALEKYKQELEARVTERTDELIKKNSELEASNQELAKTLLNLRNTQSQLVQSEKMASLGVLTAGIAHEINNPLNYIMGAFTGFTDYFNHHKSDEQQKIDILLKSLNVGIEKISSIVKGLNQFSRNNESMEEDFEVNSVLNNCLVILNNKTKHTIDIVRDYKNIQLLVKGNSGKIHQVFLNILLNSIQAIDNFGKIMLRTEVENENVVVEIKDNGIGMDKKILDKITDPFFTTKPPGHGTGLGLAIAHTIIKEHKGSIHFFSQPNQGTKVLIKLPLKQTQHEE